MVIRKEGRRRGYKEGRRRRFKEGGGITKR